MCGVAVFGHVERVGHGVVLRLESDLDDFHRGDDRDGLCDACRETSYIASSQQEPVTVRQPERHTEESCLCAHSPRLLVRHDRLVCLEGGEPDSHLGHDARNDGAEAFVETEGSLALDNLSTRGNEASRLDLRSPLAVGL